MTDKYYFFEVPEGFRLDQFAATLTWNLEVDDTDWSASLSNLDLHLYSANNFTAESIILSSDSTFNSNVELIYQESLLSGEYALRITSNGGAGTDFGFTWFGELNAVPEVGHSALLITIAIAARFYRRRVRSS